MPDRYGEDPALDVSDPLWDAERRRLRAIAQCDLCNSDGIRGDLTRCTHIDYAAAAARGMQAIREALSSNHTKKPGLDAQRGAESRETGGAA